MAQMETLHDAFLDELRDAYDAEKQLLKALPRMAKAAESDSLRTAFETHRRETEGHVNRLEQVFASLDERVRGKHCDGMAGIIEEGKAVMEEAFEGATLDALLIAAAQRAEHYEMAAYGTLVAWARVMQHENAAGLLQQILDEEKATDEKLTQMAEAGINQGAAQAGEGDQDEDEDEDQPGRSIGMTGRAMSGGVQVAGTSGSRTSASGSSGSRRGGSRSGGSSGSKSRGSRSTGGRKKR